jgi:tetratricopeptide (TPR) repeat protein
MDETDLMALIAEGENERVDFKRDLELHSARGKAEFVKDIVSLANSAPDVGYLLVGVEDNRYIVGTTEVEEERIQQIASTYITPVVSLKCYSLPVAAPTFPVVVVIEVRAFHRPHRVARAIEQLNQEDVFVRRGSIVARASAEEIIRMADGWMRQEDQIRQRISAAETHVKLRNWRDAIKLYSEAIGVAPTAELLLARGKAYESESKEQLTAGKSKGMFDEERTRYSKDYAYLRRCAYKDYSDAISLSRSATIGKEARLRRMLLDLTTGGGQDYDEWQGDVAWLKLHTEGREHGEILFWEQQVYYWRVRNEGLDQESVMALTRAIELGYAEAEVYFLRGQANAQTFNFGLALQDLDEAIARTDPKNKRLVEYLVSRAETLVEMKRYTEARETLQEARKLDARDTASYLSLLYQRDEDYKVRRALQVEFGG